MSGLPCRKAILPLAADEFKRRHFGPASADHPSGRWLLRARMRHDGGTDSRLRRFAMPLADARPIAMIVTGDRKVAEPFYAETLGLRRKGDDGFAALFDLAGVTLRLTEVPGHAAQPHPVHGWEVADIAAAVDALGTKGVAMNLYEGMGQDGRGIWTAPDGSCKVAFFNDPDGNGLSLTQLC
jgi:catechol 2,3-dioxygenase-like lactoylglutathione lyase family enzyme